MSSRPYKVNKIKDGKQWLMNTKDRIRLNTWAEKSDFEYSGNVGEGTGIFYGQDYKQKLFISKEVYVSLLNNFKGKPVNIGTSRTNPPPGSLGAWLQANATKTATASYVGPILIHEGFAIKGRDSVEIRFKD